MRTFRLVWAGAIAAFAILAGGQQATAQEASGQFYGYTSQQAPLPSGQGSGCYVEKWGCHVEVCPPPACHNVQLPVPGLEIPSCQNAYVIVNEGPPQQPQTITVFRNHYVPIKIVTQPTTVVPVNIVVKWREIHYLCDCPPGTSQCPHIPAGSSQAMPAPQASNDSKATAPSAAELAQGSTPPAETAAAAAAIPVATAPAAPAAPAESTSSKRWVWLKKQGAYGYGYQRPDGLWVIDAGSMRPTLPTAETNRPSQPTTVAVTTGS
jgi:hypothetical protein